MPNPHLAAIRSGIRYNRSLKRLTNSKIGTKEHPRGVILSAYRRARKALAGNLDNPAVVTSVLELYRAEVLQAMIDATETAIAIGVGHSDSLIAAYSLPEVAAGQAVATDEAIASVNALLSGQIQAIRSGALTEAQILGGKSRIGMFTAGLVQREAANWLGNIAAQQYGGMIGESLIIGGVANEYVRQVVAAVDERTTPCCLGAHGQTREMDEDYYTPDPPAYADYQDRPPFHDYCRTSQVLVLRTTTNDYLTRDMQRAAALETEMREKPGYSAPHPAHAFTRIRT